MGDAPVTSRASDPDDEDRKPGPSSGSMVSTACRCDTSSGWTRLWMDSLIREVRCGPDSEEIPETVPETNPEAAGEPHRVRPVGRCPVVRRKAIGSAPALEQPWIDGRETAAGTKRSGRSDWKNGETRLSPPGAGSVYRPGASGGPKRTSRPSPSKRMVSPEGRVEVCGAEGEGRPRDDRSAAKPPSPPPGSAGARRGSPRSRRPVRRRGRCGGRASVAAGSRALEGILNSIPESSDPTVCGGGGIRCASPGGNRRGGGGRPCR